MITFLSATPSSLHRRICSGSPISPTSGHDEGQSTALLLEGLPNLLRSPRLCCDHDTLNLAIGTVSTDKGGNEEGKPTWTVIAPARVESGFKEAYFNLKAIGPVMYIHATTADPSEAAP